MVALLTEVTMTYATEKVSQDQMEQLLPFRAIITEVTVS